MGIFSSSKSLAGTRFWKPSVCSDQDINLSPETTYAQWTAANLEIHSNCLSRPETPERNGTTASKKDSPDQGRSWDWAEAWSRKDHLSHQHINTHPCSIPQFYWTPVSGARQWMPSPAWRVLQGLAEVDPWVTQLAFQPITAVRPLWGHSHTQVMYLFLSFSTDSFLWDQEAELANPRAATRKEWKDVTGACWPLLALAHVIIAGHGTAITEVSKQTKMWNFP